MTSTEQNSALGRGRTKPLMRGWLHALAALAAPPVTFALCWSSRDDPERLRSMLIYGLSLSLLYTVSAVYHILPWRGKWQVFLRTLDHANIFLLIAGTYTPICYNVLRGWQRDVLLDTIWLLCGLGIFLTVFLPRRLPRPAKTALYVLLGWVGLLALPAALENLPFPGVLLMILGGILYTVGAIVYGLRWPDPFPRYFGFHEIFHVFVVVAGALYTIAIWVWIIPFPRPV